MHQRIQVFKVELTSIIVRIQGIYMLQVIEWQRIAGHIIVFVLRLLVKREYASQPLVIYLRNLTLPKI